MPAVSKAETCVLRQLTHPWLGQMAGWSKRKAAREGFPGALRGQLWGPQKPLPPQGDGLEDGSWEMRTCSRTPDFPSHKSRLPYPPAPVPPMYAPLPRSSCRQLPSLLKKKQKQTKNLSPFTVERYQLTKQ